MQHLLRALSALLFCSTLLTAQADPLVGTWRGTSADNRGESLQINADGSAVSDGDRLTWRKLRDGVIVVSDGTQPIQIGYSVQGRTLTLNILGDSYAFERVGGQPAPPRPEPVPDRGNPAGEPAPNPLGGSGNPLGGGSPPADPFVRRFEGEQIALELRAAEPSGYRGTLTFRGTEYPCTAQRGEASALRGSFDVSGTAYDFEATLDGDAMKLVSGGKTYDLQAMTKLVPAGNPLGGGGKRERPAPLQGVARERGKVWEHPRGWFRFEMPEGWSVAEQGDEAVTLNPGLTENDTLDALIMLTFGRLEAAERSVPIDRMLTAKEGELLQGMAEQGIQLQRATVPPKKVSIGEVPGAVQTWKGRTQNGVGVDVWVGALIKRDAYLAVVAILVDGKGTRFLPNIKRVFQTLRPTPPETNPALRAALVGANFGDYSTTESGSFSATYTFGDGGVRKAMVISGSQPGDHGVSTEDDGEFEVIGDEVFLYFSDGQESARVLTEGGRITGLQFGDKLYRRR